MAVSISMHSEHKNADEWLSMSNGGMAVFLDVLVLSGSRLAEETKEKELIQWIAEHDDSVRGYGCNGFDICDIPWQYENFEKERNFLLNVVDGAFKKLGWEVLWYKPTEDRIFSYLETFRSLLLAFDSSHINKEGYAKWKEEQLEPCYWCPENYEALDEKSKEIALSAFSDYKKLILKFKEYLDPEIYDDWVKTQQFPRVTLPDGFHMCKTHGTILYWHGCILCGI